MSIKNKIINVLTANPKLVTLGIGLAITFGVGIATGMVDSHHALAAHGHHG